MFEYEATITDIINENTLLKNSHNTNIYEHNKNIIDQNGLYQSSFQQLFNLVTRDASELSKNSTLLTLKNSIQSVDNEVEKIRLKSTYVINHFNKVNNQYINLNDDLSEEIKKNKDLKDGIDKLTDEVTHRDDLLSKVSESLKNKQINDSVQNEDIIKENQRLKAQIDYTDGV